MVASWVTYLFDVQSVNWTSRDKLARVNAVGGRHVTCRDVTADVDVMSTQALLSIDGNDRQ